MRNKAQAGARAERMVRQILEGSGVKVTRAAGSKGPADLIGRYKGRTYEFQVKRGQFPSIPPKERLALYAWAEWGGNTPIGVLLTAGDKKPKWYKVVPTRFEKDELKEVKLQPWTPIWEFE